MKLSPSWLVLKHSNSVISMKFYQHRHRLVRSSQIRLKIFSAWSEIFWKSTEGGSLFEKILSLLLIGELNENIKIGIMKRRPKVFNWTTLMIQIFLFTQSSYHPQLHHKASTFLKTIRQWCYSVRDLTQYALLSRRKVKKRPAMGTHTHDLVFCHCATTTTTSMFWKAGGGIAQR